MVASAPVATTEVEGCLAAFFGHMDAHVAARNVRLFGDIEKPHFTALQAAWGDRAARSRSPALEQSRGASSVSPRRQSSLAASPRRAVAAVRDGRGAQPSASPERPPIVAVETTADAKAALRESFFRFSRLGHDGSAGRQVIRRGQFLMACKECRLLRGGRVSTMTVLRAYCAAEQRSAPAAGAGAAAASAAAPGLDLDGYALAVAAVAQQLYSDLPVADAMAKVCKEHLIPAAAGGGRSPNDPLTHAESQDCYAEFMAGRVRGRLKRLYHFYALPKKQGGETPPTAVADALLPESTLLRLAHDFGLVPRLLTSRQVLACANAVRHLSTPAPATNKAGAVETAHNPAPPLPPRCLTFEQFVDALGRCALTAFRYRPALDPPPALAFEGAYSSAAKRMWLDAVLAAEAHCLGTAGLRFRSADGADCTVPAAMLQHFGPSVFRTPAQTASERADAPSVNDAGAGSLPVDSALTQEQTRWHSGTCASSTLAGEGAALRTDQCDSSGDVDVRGGSGQGCSDGKPQLARAHSSCQLLELRPDEDGHITSPSMRPLHLRHYSPDWVGEPRPPHCSLPAPTEKWRLPSACATDLQAAPQLTGDSRWEAAMAEMITARFDGELESERRRMRRLLELRNAWREALCGARARREGLQARAGQLLVFEDGPALDRLGFGAN